MANTDLTPDIAAAPGFDHSYARLGAEFSTAQPLDPVSRPEVLLWNQALADTLGWPANPLSDRDALNALAGNTPLPGSSPISTVMRATNLANTIRSSVTAERRYSASGLAREVDAGIFNSREQAPHLTLAAAMAVLPSDR